MKIITIFFNDIKKNSGGFTLIELVMTIILIGILSIGLYQVVMWGINDYLINEEYLHSNNSMTYAMTVIRRNLENAAVLTAPLTISGGVCPLNTNNYPNNGQGNNNPPITMACNDGSAPSCSNNTECPTNGNCTNPVSPSEVAFYQNIKINGVTTQQLVVFCVNPNNNALYKEVTTTNGTTVSYPVADNISSINF
jgi:prepilin-type N-terminal cleavage/methylation domain-containing protein